MTDKENLFVGQSQDKIKETLKKLLSSKIKRLPGETDEVFIAKLKEQALPLVNDLEGAQLSNFSHESDLIKDLTSPISNNLIQKIKDEKGIAISFSEDSPNYKEIKSALLEVIEELKGIEVTGN